MAVHLSREGLPSGAISIPTRNLHSSGEIINKVDVIECSKLVQAITK